MTQIKLSNYSCPGIFGSALWQNLSCSTELNKVLEYIRFDWNSLYHNQMITILNSSTEPSLAFHGHLILHLQWCSARKTTLPYQTDVAIILSVLPSQRPVVVNTVHFGVMQYNRGEGCTVHCILLPCIWVEELASMHLPSPNTSSHCLFSSKNSPAYLNGGLQLFNLTL